MLGAELDTMPNVPCLTHHGPVVVSMRGDPGMRRLHEYRLTTSGCDRVSGCLAYQHNTPPGYVTATESVREPAR